MVRAAETELPPMLRDLTPGERLVVSSFRRWVVGLQRRLPAQWQVVRNEFMETLGARDGNDALAAFAGLMREICCHARRTISYHEPCCPCLGEDETVLLRLLAGCQNSSTAIARDAAEDLVLPDAAGGLLAAAASLMLQLSRHELVLPCPQAAPPEPRRRPAGATLH